MDESNKVENINIERTKKLFEYEMTEVILKLKGEFAAFSGEGTEYAEMAVQEVKLKCSILTLPEMKLEKHSVDLVELPEIIPYTAPELCAERPGLEIPYVPDMTKIEHSIGEHANGKKEIPEIEKIEVPSIPDLSSMDKSVFSISFDSHPTGLEGINQQQYSIPNISQAISAFRGFEIENAQSINQVEIPNGVNVSFPTFESHTIIESQNVKEAIIALDGITVPSTLGLVDQIQRINDLAFEQDDTIIFPTINCSNLVENLEIREKDYKAQNVIPVPKVHELHLDFALPTPKCDEIKNINQLDIPKVNSFECPNIMADIKSVPYVEIPPIESVICDFTFDVSKIRKYDMKDVVDDLDYLTKKCLDYKFCDVSLETCKFNNTSTPVPSIPDISINSDFCVDKDVRVHIPQVDIRHLVPVNLSGLKTDISKNVDAISISVPNVSGFDGKLACVNKVITEPVFIPSKPQFDQEIAEIIKLAKK